MMMTLAAVALAVITAAVVWAAVRGHLMGVRTVEGVVDGLAPVDLQAMRNLLDPAEEDFLRAHLAPRAFRHVQRARNRAAMEYVSAIAHNAALLIRLGEMARNSEDAALRSSAERIIDAALAVRLHALAAMAKLVLSIIIPHKEFSGTVPVDGYERLRAVLLASTGDQARAMVILVASAL